MFVDDQVEGDALDAKLLAQVLHLGAGEAVVFTMDVGNHVVPGVDGGAFVGQVEEDNALGGHLGFGGV